VLPFLARRLLLAVPTTLAAVLVVFVAVRVVPGNPALARLGRHVNPEQVAEEMRRHGWDRPVIAQMGEFLRGLLLRGDLGRSFYDGRPVTEELLRRFPATIELSLAALLLAVPVGIGAGVLASVYRNRPPDLLCMTGAMLGVSVPVFFLGMVLILLFTPGLPGGGRLDVRSLFQPPTGFVLLDSLLARRTDVFVDALRHLVLPALALSTIPAALIAHITRSSMLEVLGADYVRTARAKGVSPTATLWRHALRNAAVPVVNIAGLQLAYLLAGAVLTETVFQWPGVGTYLVKAARDRDYAAIQGGTLLVALTFVLVNLLVDVLYAALDPRIAYERKEAR
jgi:peptide/nickel transport system permease protein